MLLTTINQQPVVGVLYYHLFLATYQLYPQHYKSKRLYWEDGFVCPLAHEPTKSQEKVMYKSCEVKINYQLLHISK